MGIPAGHPDFVVPELLVQVLTVLGFIGKPISFFSFPTLGFSYFLEPDTAFPIRPEFESELHSISGILIRELLPVVKFSDLIDPPETCAVCLCKFSGTDKIRRLINCQHIFHRSCLDRWMDHDQKTCPLCRTTFIPDWVMGFPVGYADFFLPTLLVHVLSLLGFIRKRISKLFATLGLGDFLEPDTAITTQPECASGRHSVSAVLIRELLPIVKFSDLIDPPESCAVCLCEFDGSDEIRRLTNCRHIFHQSCLDRWMDRDQKTCPLCRTPLIPEDMQEVFNEKFWAACGISDFYGEYSLAH
ncbi:unnamed protein product [Ilex paraguariensis]|uniref:RING-type domain-containing protein n=1 Tax=Ilex paraguariensis TaxID=185542 RepID=A0ABC8SNL5_9AQUA